MWPASTRIESRTQRPCRYCFGRDVGPSSATSARSSHLSQHAQSIKQLSPLRTLAQPAAALSLRRTGPLLRQRMAAPPPLLSAPRRSADSPPNKASTALSAQLQSQSTLHCTPSHCPSSLRKRKAPTVLQPRPLFKPPARISRPISVKSHLLRVILFALPPRGTPTPARKVSSKAGAPLSLPAHSAWSVRAVALRPCCSARTRAAGCRRRGLASPGARWESPAACSLRLCRRRSPS